MRATLASTMVLLLATACSGGQQQQKPADLGPSQKKDAPAVAVDTKIVSFAVSPDNLKVDAIGMTPGSLYPDGTRDHAFSVTIDGPVDAIFLGEVNHKGDPKYGFRASTVGRNEEIPKELGGVVDVGVMTAGIAVSEKGHFVNDAGGVKLGPGTHVLTLYAPNTAALQSGDFVRLWVRLPSGGLAVSAVIQY